MKLLRRSTIVAAALAATLAVSTAPAAAIVGGHDATQTYPGMAAMSVLFPGLGTAHCGASLVHPRFILTAAHCVSDQNTAPTPVAVPGANITVRIGSNDRTTGGVLATGKQVYLHPDWYWGLPTGKPVSDLALVELDHDIRMPLTLISDRQVAESDSVRLIGWGLTAYPPRPGATLPITLQERDTTRLPAADCDGGFIGEAEACYGGQACYGDSGSPALRRIGNLRFGKHSLWASIGIASREASGTCANTVYTDPTYGPFRTWAALTIIKRRVIPCTCPPTTFTFDGRSDTLTNLLEQQNVYN